MKKLFFFFIIICEICLGEQKIKTLVSVNNKIITNLDIINEVELIKYLNQNKQIDVKKLEEIAKNNLIDQTIKKIEIDKNLVEINENILKEQFFEILKKHNINNSEISKTLKDNIFRKIENDAKWNNLISQKYSWKININLDEIDQKIKFYENSKDQDSILIIKNRLIENEKNKKLQIYSQSYFNNLKINSLIKYYK